GNVHGLAAANNLLAWRAGDGVVVAIDEVAVEPEAEGAEVLLLLIELRDPRGAGVQRLGEVAGERAEERPAGFGAGSLDHAPQRSIRVDLLEWLRHPWPVCPATGPASRSYADSGRAGDGAVVALASDVEVLRLRVVDDEGVGALLRLQHELLRQVHADF